MLLDTSALMALCLEERGGDEVQDAVEAGTAWVAAVSWLELWINLDPLPHGREAIALYEAAVAGTIDISMEVARAALDIRRATQNRVPTVDSLIAGAARVHGMELMHRDAHFAAIPPRLLKQRMLPAK
ncbi:MAG: PIN domain-containing protein [Bryobacteraceae bacterium]